MKRYGEEYHMDQKMMDCVADYMDEEVREDLHESLAPCEPEKFLAVYLYREPEFADLLESEFGITVTEAEILAAAISTRDTWDDSLNHQFCELAGLGKEYDVANGDEFERVVYEAAEELGVMI